MRFRTEIADCGSVFVYAAYTLPSGWLEFTR